MELTVHHIHTHHFPDCGNADSTTAKLLAEILHNQKLIMSTLADLQAAVTAEDTVIQSAITLIQGLAAQIAALQPNQAAIDALAADVSAQATALGTAVAAGTPATPAPAPAPTA